MPRAKLNYDSGQVKNIHYGDILTKFDSVINISEEDVPYITDGIPEDYCKNLLKNGDVIFADTAEDETAGKAIEISGIIDNFVVSGLHTLAARPHIKFASNYLGYYLNSISYHKQLLKFMQGIKVLSISKRNLAKTIIKYPQKITEQEKTGSFFKHIDSLITLHQRKVNSLQRLKKALLQKMFPAKDKKVTELRFKRFIEDWEQSKLGDVVDIFDGTHQTPIYTNCGIKFVSVENIKNLESKKYISCVAYQKEYANKQAEKGDILMTRIGDIGTAKVIETSDPLAYYVTLALLKPKGVKSNFLVWLITSPKVQRNIWKRTLHIAFPKKINLGEINQIEVDLPVIEEQKKIGSFFKVLDNLITLHQSKLEKLKSLKQAYLQKMFI